MNATYESLEGRAEGDLYRVIESLVKKNPWSWQSVCAVLGLAGGVIAPFLGAASDVISWFVGSAAVNSYLHASSIVFCALTIPLIVLGAYSLDLLEAKTSRLSPAHKPLRTKPTLPTAHRPAAVRKRSPPP